MTARAAIGLSVAWPLAVAAVVVFGAAWFALAGAQWCAGLFADDADEELENPSFQGTPHETTKEASR